uniref:Putative secreted protein n=1 Tax=Anopheles darlingi TaxID=43151 RepID=A0A2M4D932_ANODA
MATAATAVRWLYMFEVTYAACSGCSSNSIRRWRTKGRPEVRAYRMGAVSRFLGPCRSPSNAKLNDPCASLFHTVMVCRIVVTG